MMTRRDMTVFAEACGWLRAHRNAFGDFDCGGNLAYNSIRRQTPWPVGALYLAAHERYATFAVGQPHGTGGGPRGYGNARLEPLPPLVRRGLAEERRPAGEAGDWPGFVGRSASRRAARCVPDGDRAAAGD